MAQIEGKLLSSKMRVLSKRRLVLKTFVAVLFVIVLTPAFSLPEDQRQVVYLRADSADISQENHKGVYIGNVELDQGSTHLRAAEAVTLGNHENKLIKAVAKGNSREQAHYWTLPSEDKPMLHAFADVIYYYPLQHKITLIGNAKIAQGDNSFVAPEIHYDTERQHVVTKRSGKQRTVITFYPEKNHE